MNTQPGKYPLKLIGALILCVSGLIYAVAILNTADQPTVSIGKYALKSRDLTAGDTLAFRSWYENGAWQGDIIEYEILQDGGLRRTDVAVGANPATEGNLGYCGDRIPGCWSARATFIANGADSYTGTYWQSRNIFTNNSGQVDFLWDNLSAAQKSALDATTIADPDGDPTTSDAVDPAVSQSDDYFSPILNWIRGKRGDERSQDGGFLRSRYSVLADITRTPVYIEPPGERLNSLAGFSVFQTANASRAGRLAVPANDGMLHVLTEADGSEVYAYIPSMVINKLDVLAARGTTYTHTYYLDGELVDRSAQVNPSTCTTVDTSGCNWRTVLAGGGGAGFKGLFALDVTNPTFTGNEILFEQTGADFGHIYGEPVIAPLGTTASPAWYVFTGNGYGNTGDKAQLLMIPLDGSYTPIAIDTGGAGTAGTYGLSAPTLLSSDESDLMPEIAFAGDTNGDLWMFRLDKATPSNTTAVKVFDGDPERPITVTPAITEDPDDLGNFIVFFGTGSILSQADALDDASSQAIYGIYIAESWIGGGAVTAITDTDLVVQALDTTSQTVSGQKVRVMLTNNPVPFDTKKGWKLPLPDCGQRLVGAPFVRSGRLQFITSNPTGPDSSPSDGCLNRTSLPGDSWVMSLDFLTGGDGGIVVYNLNGDEVLDENDTADPGNNPPVALHLGVGNIAQPAFLRLRSGIDKMYINGIILAVPLIAETGPILGGHIDVHTDSPFGGETAPNGMFKHSEGYNVTTNDGLGGAVDGHFHDYDTVHGVDYVDLFELEPRRGLANLAPSTASMPAATSDPACSDTENEKRILVNDRCIEAVEAELNRAYDTHTFVDQETDGTCPSGSEEILDEGGAIIQCRQPPVSEVYDSTLAALDENQKFIVILANADRSLSGTLQIGCRTWGVLPYQDAITDALELTELVPDDPLPAYITDNNLVFTLKEILADTTECAADIPTGISGSPTLRIGFGQRALLGDEYGLLGTRSQCVLGLHDYLDPVDYQDENVLCYADSVLNPGASSAHCTDLGLTNPETADSGYIRDPDLNLHITNVFSSEGTGFRWRNGALTLQLLAVTADNKVDFTLQPPETNGQQALPEKSNNRFGGTIAKAFSVAKVAGKLTITADATTKGTGNGGDTNSGLLYEAAMYWHYSDLADNLRTGDPASTPCYGDPSWKGRITQELGGLTLGEYSALVNPLLSECEDIAEGQECALNAFDRLLTEIDAAATEEELNAALLELADLLADNPNLAEYVRFREYAPGHVPEQHLLNIDKNLDGSDGSDNSSSTDGTPGDVTAIEVIDLETKGPNTSLGRRNWIDILQ